MKHLKLNTHSGFTLVELLIVVAIIGVLASLILPRIFGPTEQSRSAEARNMLGAIRQLEEAARNGPNGYIEISDPAGIGCGNSDDWQQLGMENPNTNPNNYFTYCIDTVSATTFRARAVRKDLPAGSVPAGKTYDICLNQAGIWSTLQTSPYPAAPKNASVNPDCTVPSCC